MRRPKVEDVIFQIPAAALIVLTALMFFAMKW
jgi:hypothetical protein